MFGLISMKKHDEAVDMLEAVIDGFAERIRSAEQYSESLEKKLRDMAYDSATLTEMVESLTRRNSTLENALKVSEQTRKKAVLERARYKMLYEALQEKEGDI